VAIIGLLINFAIVALVYRKVLRESTTEPAANQDGPRTPVLHPLLYKSVAVTLVTVGLFFAGLPIALVALVAAAVLMLDRVRPERIYHAVDWPLLVMFAGLFVVVHAFEVNVVHTWGLERWRALLDSPVVLLSGLSVVLSNLVSNVPAVLLFKPLMEVMPQKELAWLALSMSSTLAGNLTVLGSVANLIVVENARRAGTELSFAEYLKVGVPLTVLTTLVGVAWLSFTHY
jgi:Na+/H+ antiporter NhaD/arsenite permease-like protein